MAGEEFKNEYSDREYYEEEQDDYNDYQNNHGQQSFFKLG